MPWVAKRSWGIAKATVLDSTVLEVGPYFVAVVRYRYSLGVESAYRGAAERSYDGRWESPPMPTRAEAEAHLARYPLGERQDPVYYDPARPSRSSLEPPGREIPRGIVLLCVVIVALGAIAGTVVRP